MSVLGPGQPTCPGRASMLLGADRSRRRLAQLFLAQRFDLVAERADLGVEIPDVVAKLAGDLAGSEADGAGELVLDEVIEGALLAIYFRPPPVSLRAFGLKEIIVILLYARRELVSGDDTTRKLPTCSRDIVENAPSKSSTVLSGPPSASSAAQILRFTPIDGVMAVRWLAENGEEAPAPVARRQARRRMATRRPDVVSGPIRRSSQFTPARALPDSSGNA
jgi:hypothetical protein